MGEKGNRKTVSGSDALLLLDKYDLNNPLVSRQEEGASACQLELFIATIK